MTATPTDARTTAIAFRVGGQRYALGLDVVREIQQIVEFAGVPEDREGVLGIVDIRGEAVLAVDGRALLGLEPEPYTLDTPMLVVEGPAGRVALLVDVVDDVIELGGEDVVPAAGVTPYLSGLQSVVHGGEGLVVMLDVAELLAPLAGAEGEVHSDG